MGYDVRVRISCDFMFCLLSNFVYKNSRRSYGSCRVSADFVDIVRSPDIIVRSPYDVRREF